MTEGVSKIVVRPMLNDIIVKVVAKASPFMIMDRATFDKQKDEGYDFQNYATIAGIGGNVKGFELDEHVEINPNTIGDYYLEVRDNPKSFKAIAAAMKELQASIAKETDPIALEVLQLKKDDFYKSKFIEVVIYYIGSPDVLVRGFYDEQQNNLFS